MVEVRVEQLPTAVAKVRDHSEITEILMTGVL